MYHSPRRLTSTSPLESYISNLLAAGAPAASVNAAIKLMRTGVADLLQRVLDRELDPETAWQIARRRGRR